ncbi:hypothetical protein F4553_002586 [Allocatelliglobosispora scoriae]|uniref:Acetone carboxylase n=1 Tax=Allocatelliglobosispora scoriae TaxID=643052 RepID=A0A841BJB8_9ACTN|nr:hypothetical protein [Allocatelliglobosispora scoriae]MBB5869207.1 hypothetical protein [Allocatelliglobosispora scoriae]
MLFTDPVESPAGHLSCSAKGCRNTATWSLLWRNPKLHDEARRKTWLACDEHRSTLGDFLSARSFLLATEPIAQP